MIDVVEIAAGEDVIAVRVEAILGAQGGVQLGIADRTPKPAGITCPVMKNCRGSPMSGQ
jgi:hypothetical protein